MYSPLGLGTVSGCLLYSLVSGMLLVSARADQLLDPELRPKNRVPCAVALGSEPLRRPKKAIREMAPGMFERTFIAALEQSNCKKDDILSYMDEIGAELEGTFKSKNRETCYYLLDLNPYWLPFYAEAKVIFSIDTLEKFCSLRGA